jgi:hypothetical protein
MAYASPALNSLIELATAAVYALKALAKALTQDFAGASEALTASGQHLGSSLKYNIESIYEGIQAAAGIKDALGQGMLDAIQGIKDAAPDIKDAWEKAMAGIGQLPGDALGGEGYNFKNVELPRWGESEAFNNLNEEIKTSIENFGSLGISADETFSGIGDSVEEITKAIKEQTDTFANFGNMFDKNVIEKISPARIMRRLQQTFSAMMSWTSSLAKLEERGVSSEIIDSLRGMGLAGAGYAMGMARMSDTQLSKAQELMWGSRILGGQQATATVNFQHSGQIWVYGVNESGELKDKGIIDMVAAEIKAGAQRYVNLPGAANLLK